MKDRNVEFPNRYRMTKVPGTDDIFDLIPAPGEVFEEGDFLNKSTLLTDALCTALGLATTATPTEAMEKLRQLVNTAQDSADGKLSISTGTVEGTNTQITLTFPISWKVFFCKRSVGDDNEPIYIALNGADRMSLIGSGYRSTAMQTTDKTISFVLGWYQHYYIAIG